MLNLANQVVDFYDDIYKTQLAKIAMIASPDLKVLSIEERSKLSPNDFALNMITKKASRLSKYPIDSRDSTWLSNQYFDMNCEKLPKTAAAIAAVRIKTACERFKVTPTPAVEKYAAILSTEKTASINNTYFEDPKEGLTKKANREDVSLEKIAAVSDVGDNYTHAQYAMPTPAHVKVACKYLTDMEQQIPLEERVKYAAAIQRRAHELGMGAQGGVATKYASDHYSGMVGAHLRIRAGLLEGINPEMHQMIDKLASAQKDLTPMQFAQALYGFDKKAHLTQYYGGYLTDPFQATFASEPDQYAGWRVKVGSTTLTPDDVRKIATEKYAKVKDYFGAGVADEFKKDPIAIFDSLPNDAKEVMANIFEGVA